MASQAPAIVGVRPSGANATLGLPAWLRGIGVRQVRIACGLVMFSYIFLAFFQSCARQHLLRDDGSMVVVPHLVVANFDCQRHALRRSCDAFLARPVGTLSAAAFSLHGRGNHPTAAGLEHPALARQPLWSRASRWLAVRARSDQLCSAAAGLLGRKTAHDRGAVRAVDDRVDARLHWAVFLAAAEALLQMGVADLFRH